MSYSQLRALFYGLLFTTFSPLSFAELVEVPPGDFSVAIAKGDRVQAVLNSTVTLVNITNESFEGPIEF